MYDHSYLSHKTRCIGFISRKYTPGSEGKKKKAVKEEKLEPETEPEKDVKPVREKKPSRNFSYIKITNQIPVDDPTDKRRNVIIKTWGGSYSIKTLSEHLNVRLKTISDAVKGFKEITIDGNKYTIEKKLSKVDLYYKGVLIHSGKTIKEATLLINRSKPYVSQLKNNGKTTEDGWSVKQCY